MKFYLIVLLLVASLSIPFEAHGAAKSMKDYKSPLVVLPPIEWTGANPNSRKVQEYFNSLSRRERQAYFHGIINSPKAQAYFHGVLETFGFFLFMNWTRTPENEQQYSDFRQCAENNRNLGWPISSWFRSHSSGVTAAVPLIRAAYPMLCDEYGGKGDGGWTPIDLATKQEWRNYSAVERKFYVGAYIETALEATVLLQENGLLPKDGRLNSLVQCITDNGLEKILETLEDTEIEAQFPMPWTVSKAIDSVCDG